MGVMFKVFMMKYLLVIPIILGAFYVGVFYENKRLVGEPDITIAVMLSALAINNAKHQLQLNSEYLALIENGKLEKLKEEINSNSQFLGTVKSDAESVCKDANCSDKHMEVIINAVNN